MTRHYTARGYGFWSAMGNPMENSIALANLMFGGVLDAFPKLRFCFMEGGGTQVPHLMDSLAVVYQAKETTTSSKRGLNLRASRIHGPSLLRYPGRRKRCSVCCWKDSGTVRSAASTPTIPTPIPWEVGPTPWRVSKDART